MNRLWRGLHAALVGGWLGAAILVASVVAPHAFASFATRSEAGDYVGGVLRVLDGWAIGAGLAAVGVAIVRGGSLSRARIATATLLAIAGLASLGLDAKIAALRRTLGPIDRLAIDDPGRRHFGMLHGISMLILLAGILAAAASVALESYSSSSSG